MKFAQTWEELVARFGAITIQPELLRGIWQHEEERYEDTLIRFILDLEDTSETEKFFLAFKETLKRRFRQVDIWMVAYPVRII